MYFNFPEPPKPDEKPEDDVTFKHRKETRSIPLNLQRLFTRLQLSEKRAVSTKVAFFENILKFIYISNLQKASVGLTLTLLLSMMLRFKNMQILCHILGIVPRTI